MQFLSRPNFGYSHPSRSKSYALFAGHTCWLAGFVVAVSTANVEGVEGVFAVIVAEDGDFYDPDIVIGDVGTVADEFIAYFDAFVAFVSDFIGDAVDAFVDVVDVVVVCPIIHLPSTRVYPP